MNLSAEKPNRRPIRLCSAVYDVIDSEAAYRGEKAGIDAVFGKHLCHFD